MRIQNGSLSSIRPSGLRRRRMLRETGRTATLVVSAAVLIGEPANEQVEGVWGNRGHAGETWFPPRERAEGERRSFLRHPHERDVDHDEEGDDQEDRHAHGGAVADVAVVNGGALVVDRHRLSPEAVPEEDLEDVEYAQRVESAEDQRHEDRR